MSLGLQTYLQAVKEMSRADAEDPILGRPRHIFTDLYALKNKADQNHRQGSTSPVRLEGVTLFDDTLVVSQ